MSRRRWIIVLSIFVILLVGIEVTLRRWTSPKACVQIVNEGDAAIENLVLSYGDTKVQIGRLPMRESTHVWVTAGPKGLLRLDFRQKSNALSGFQVADFDPRQNLQDGFKLVLVIKTNEVQRFVEDDESRMDRETLKNRLWRWLSSELAPAR